MNHAIGATMITQKTLVSILSGLVLSGCAAAQDRKAAQISAARQSMMDSIVTRASFETGCQQDQIDAKFIDPVNIGVNACGQKLIFVVLPNAAGVDCGHPETWSVNIEDAFPKYCNAVLNSAGTLQESPTPLDPLE